MNCAHCNEAFTGRKRKYCTKTCSRKATRDSQTTTCAIDGCANHLRAKMLCGTHYNKQYRKPNPTAKFDCPSCGKAFTTERSRANRYARLYCSTKCRDIGRSAQAHAVELWHPQPALHRFIYRMPKPTAYRTRVHVSGSCKRCGASYLNTQLTARFCSLLCAKRWHRDARKERLGYTIPKSVRTYVYARDGQTCQLCHEPVDMDLPAGHRYAPTLDHIVCQSWTLVPDHSPNNLRLSHMVCNALRGNEGQGKWTDVRIAS